jgi:hypothetical protein
MQVASSVLQIPSNMLTDGPSVLFPPLGLGRLISCARIQCSRPMAARVPKLLQAAMDAAAIPSQGPLSA